MEKVKVNNRSKVQDVQILVTAGDLKGEIDLIWEPVYNANSYVIQCATSASDSRRWKHIDIVGESRCTVSRLKSGYKYCFRIAAITSRGQSPWSEIVTKTAP